MNSDWQRIDAGKRALRLRLAALPIADKLRLLDDLRERALTLRRAGLRASPAGNTVREQPPPYRPGKTE